MFVYRFFSERERDREIKECQAPQHFAGRGAESEEKSVNTNGLTFRSLNSQNTEQSVNHYTTDVCGA
jgi:hypothetical protein